MNLLNLRSAGVATAILALGLPASAHHVGEMWQAGDIVVSHAWTYENATMGHAINVYVTVDNQGTEADRLIGASVEFADATVFQAQILGSDGTLEVRDVPAIKINPGQALTLQPGAAWIELESVHRTFEHGEHFDMTLTFEQAGTVEIEVEVEEAGGDDDPAA